MIASFNTETGINNLSTNNPMPTPSGVVAGNLFVAVCAHDSLTVITASTGWTQIAQVEQPTVTHRCDIFGRIADGGANDALSLSGGASDYCTSIMRITGHGVTNVATDIKKVDAVSTGSTNPDPPSLDAGSSKRWLWLVAAGVDTTSAFTMTTPTNYTDVHAPLQSATNVSGQALFVAQRALNTQTENPGVFTTGTVVPWIAHTLAIPPTS